MRYARNEARREETNVYLWPVVGGGVGSNGRDDRRTSWWSSPPERVRSMDAMQGPPCGGFSSVRLLACCATLIRPPGGHTPARPCSYGQQPIYCYPTYIVIRFSYKEDKYVLQRAQSPPLKAPWHGLHKRDVHNCAVRLWWLAGHKLSYKNTFGMPGG